MMRGTVALGALAVAAALAVSAPITLARFTDSSTSTATLGTATLRPPTAVTATGGSSAALAWTASSSIKATGYQLLRSATSGSGYAQVKTVTPISATATTDTPGAGTWYYVLDSYFGNWTSAFSNQATVTIASQRTTPTTGCDPTMQAAETSGAGNNDGYDLNPGNACAADGSYAVDTNSGTDNVGSCSDAGKDRHRFWGYALGLPGTVTSIDGIAVTAVLGQSNSGGTSSVCLQLSWDGGATWTAARQVPLTAAALTTYVTGSASDTWGHTWTAAQLSATALRIRVTDVATTPNKDFRLDSLGVTVTYTP